uniref:FXYD domain-containing ion transport regulator n=1 Tax=Oryzias melastigma TaxID=30732 RepID=A0A3B3CDB5_ORYME
MSANLKMTKICALVLMTRKDKSVEPSFLIKVSPFGIFQKLRVGGLILAAVLCLIGITILLSGHCRCKFNQDKRRRTGSNAQAMLTDEGRACNC